MSHDLGVADFCWEFCWAQQPNGSKVTQLILLVGKRLEAQFCANAEVGGMNSIHFEMKQKSEFLRKGAFPRCYLLVT